jgi:predicted nucleotidyltransferase
MDKSYSKIYEKLLKSLQQYSKELQEDIKLDKTQLENSFNIAEIITKWIDRKIKVLKLYYNLEKEQKVKYKDLWEYYKMDYEFEIKNKSEMDTLIESDADYKELMSCLKLSKELIKFIEDAIDVLKLKHWERRDYIEYIKFINGG